MYLFYHLAVNSKGPFVAIFSRENTGQNNSTKLLH